MRIIHERMLKSLVLQDGSINYASYHFFSEQKQYRAEDDYSTTLTGHQAATKTMKLTCHTRKFKGKLF